MDAVRALRQVVEWTGEHPSVTLVCDFSRSDGSHQDYYYATSSPFVEMVATLIPERRLQGGQPLRDPQGFSSLPPGRGLFHRWHQVRTAQCLAGRYSSRHYTAVLLADITQDITQLSDTALRCPFGR